MNLNLPWGSQLQQQRGPLLAALVALAMLSSAAPASSIRLDNVYNKRAPFSSWAGKRSAAVNELSHGDGMEVAQMIQDLKDLYAIEKEREFAQLLRKQHKPHLAHDDSMKELSLDEEYPLYLSSSEEKRAPFSAWAGKRAPFSSWAGKRAPFSSWAGKRAPFSSWAGKRSSLEAIRSEEDLDSGEIPKSRVKRSSDEFEEIELPEKSHGERTRRSPAFSSWGGKRSNTDSKKRIARHVPVYVTSDNKPLRRPARSTTVFSAWGGK